MKESFFESTPVYKKYMLLRILERGRETTQRDIAKELNISVAMANFYVDMLEEEGFLKRNYSSKKTVFYDVTSKGIDYRKNLSIDFLKSSLEVYNIAKLEIVPEIYNIQKKGYRNILMYGAGEVCELLLYVLSTDSKVEINVLALIDDDESKIGKVIGNKPIISPNDIKNYNYDGILISSYRHFANIYKRIKEMNISKEKIINFFEEF